MNGIQYVVDEAGNHTAVLIDLKQIGDAWEDIYDILVSAERDDEPTVAWEELKKEIENTK